MRIAIDHDRETDNPTHKCSSTHQWEDHVTQDTVLIMSQHTSLICLLHLPGVKPTCLTWYILAQFADSLTEYEGPTPRVHAAGLVQR